QRMRTPLRPSAYPSRSPACPFASFFKTLDEKNGIFSARHLVSPVNGRGARPPPRYNRWSLVRRTRGPVSLDASAASTVGGQVEMIRLSRAAFALLLAGPLPAMARAQEAAPTPTPTPNALVSPAPDNRPVLELSLDDTVKRTLENNAD